MAASGAQCPADVVVRLLGPLQVEVGGHAVDLRGLKPKAILAMLALQPGSVVSVNAIVDGVWGDDPPASVANSLQVHVSALRRALGPAGAALRNRPPGYVLDVPAGCVDAGRVEQAMAAARASGAAADWQAVTDLWRGDSLADLLDAPFARPVATRLDELRATAVEERIEGALAAGQAGTVLTELEALVIEHPYRERLWRQLMLALYRDGRQSDALAAFARVRRILAEDLGLQPGPALAALNSAVLAQDPSLDPAEAGGPLGLRLPAPVDRIVGRHAEMDSLSQAVREARLVSLTGLGGSGKTRLAVETARRLGEDFAGGVVFVDLSAVLDPALVPPAVAQAIDADPGGDPVPTIAAALGAGRVLIVLDNMEQVVGAGTDVTRLLSAAPDCHVLVTSRVPLGQPGERVVALGPLPPDDAVALFLARARAANGRFVDDGAVAPLCAHLDGIPLALELAAARTRTLTASALMDRLGAPGSDPDAGAGELAAHDPTDRRRGGLQAVLAWTVAALTPQARELLCVLARFATAPDLAAAEAVSGLTPAETDDALDHLVTASLVLPVEGRYRMLDTVRGYAQDLLGRNPDAAAVADRHAAWVCDATIRADAAVRGADERSGRTALAALLPDLRVATAHALEQRQFDRAATLLIRGRLAWWDAGAFGEGQSLLERVAESAAQLPESLSAEVEVLRGVYLKVGGSDDAEPIVRDGVERMRAAHVDGPLRVVGLCHLAAISAERGEHEAAWGLAEEAVEAAKHAADDGAVTMAFDLSQFVAALAGDHARAVEAGRQAVAVGRLGGSVQLATALAGLAAALAASGEVTEACLLGREALATADETAVPTIIAQVVYLLALDLPAQFVRSIADRVVESIALLVTGNPASALGGIASLARAATDVDPRVGARLLGGVLSRQGEEPAIDLDAITADLVDRLGAETFAAESRVGAALSEDALLRMAASVAAVLIETP